MTPPFCASCARPITGANTTAAPSMLCANCASRVRSQGGLSSLLGATVDLRPDRFTIEPKIEGVVHAYRWFTLSGLSGATLHGAAMWPTREMEAVCGTSALDLTKENRQACLDHIRHRTHSCGTYGVFDPSVLPEMPGVAHVRGRGFIADCVYFGPIEIQPDRLRAANARIEALFTNGDVGEQQCRIVAELYGVHVYRIFWGRKKVKSREPLDRYVKAVLDLAVFLGGKVNGATCNEYGVNSIGLDRCPNYWLEHRWESDVTHYMHLTNAGFKVQQQGYTEAVQEVFHVDLPVREPPRGWDREEIPDERF